MEAIYSNILEINPQEIFSHMKENIYNNYSNEKKLNIDKDYLKIRAELISLIHKISKKMGFKSQTFFLSIYYLDIILLQNKIKINNLNLLGLSCFIIASKYCENDPIVPPLDNYLNFYNKYNSNINKKIKLEELFEMEVKVLKYLNYNLHHLTIYDFNLFFFNHGIIKKQQIKDIINNNVNCNNNKNNKTDISSNEEDNDLILDGNYIKKILEKIYKKSRYYLDLIIINEKICFKYNVLLLSVYIMKKSIEEIILNEYKIKNKDYYLNKKQIVKKTNLYFKEIMYNFYKIDYESNKKYQELIKDKEIINIFPQQEKINELKNKKKNDYKTNINSFKKIFPSNKKSFNENNNFIRKNNIFKNSINNNIGIGISNLATSSTIEENQSPNIILNSFILKNQNILSQNNSKEKIKNNKTNNTLFENYNNNKIFQTKTFLNNKKYSNNNINNSNSNIDINKKITVNNNSNFNSYIEKSTTNCTFTQLKNNLKKNYSLNKKRCKDRYSHINNLKSLCKLTSCSNTIKNIKEGSFLRNNLLEENHSPLPDKNVSRETEGVINRINSFIDKSTNNLYLIKKVKNLKNYFSKDKINNKNNFNLLDYNNIKDELNEININNSYDKSFQSNKSNKNNKKEKEEKEEKEEKNKKGIKEINLIRLKYRTNTLNKNKNINNNDTNRNKPYFKKVIHNFDPMKRKTINKNNIKINISNILNKSNFNNLNNGINNKTTTNKNNNYISLSNYNQNNDNKLELIKKRIISINKRNANLDLLIDKNNNSIGTKLSKGENENNLNIDNGIIQNSKLINLSQNKIRKIPKNLKISTNFYEKKNNIRYGTNESPILFSKEIKALNINNDNNLYHNNDLNLKIKETSSTIENTSSYHKKKVFNSLNQNKNTVIIKAKNDEKDYSNENNNINYKKIDCNSFYKKYKNVFIISGENNNFINKKMINNVLNTYNTINSTKNNLENKKKFQNGHL